MPIKRSSSRNIRNFSLILLNGTVSSKQPLQIEQSCYLQLFQLKAQTFARYNKWWKIRSMVRVARSRENANVQGKGAGDAGVELKSRICFSSRKGHLSGALAHCRQRSQWVSFHWNTLTENVDDSLSSYFLAFCVLFWHSKFRQVTWVNFQVDYEWTPNKLSTSFTKNKAEKMVRGPRHFAGKRAAQAKDMTTFSLCTDALIGYHSDDEF